MAFLAPASPDQVADIVEQTFPLWGAGLGREGYERYNEAQLRSAWGRSHLQRLVLADGRRWLSTAKRYDVRGRLDGRPVRILGIGAVFTPPALRRRGHAAELLGRMIEQAEGEGFDLALLFSEIGVGYYRSLGFEPVRVSQLNIRVDVAAPARAIVVRAGDDDDFAAIAEMNARQAEGCRFSVARDPEYVAFAMLRKRLVVARPDARRRLAFLVADEDGRAAAYLVVLVIGDSWMVTECGDRDPSGARVGAMLQSLLAGATHAPARIRAWFPARFLPPPVHVVVRETPSLVMMLRPIRRGLRIDPPLAADDLAYWHADAF